MKDSWDSRDSCSKINLHANCLLGLLNTNCTNYTNMLLENGKIVSFKKSVESVWEISTFLTLLSRILSQTFRSSPYSRRPSGRDRRDRTCDTPLPCCQDSPLSASPGLWCSDASSAKNEAGSRTGYDWHNPLRHAWLNSHSCGQPPLRCVPHCYCRRGWYPSKRAVPFWFL